MLKSRLETETIISDRLGTIVDQFSEAIERGDSPDIEQVLSEHADLEEVLRPLLTAIAKIEMGGLGDLRSDSLDCRCLGDFRLVREIGRGGMGIVYEAEQVSLSRKVAVKILPFAAAIDAKALERFRNEVRACATLEHPNIVPIHFVGEERGVHFYAMKLIQGTSLAEVIQQLREMRGRAGSLCGQSIGDSLSRTVDPSEGALHQHAPEPPETNTADRKGDSAALVETHPMAGNVTETSRSHVDYYRHVVKLGIQAASGLSHAHVTGRFKTSHCWALQTQPKTSSLRFIGLFVFLIGIGPGGRFGRF